MLRAENSPPPSPRDVRVEGGLGFTATYLWFNHKINFFLRKVANTVVVDVEGNVQFSDVSSHNISVNNFDVTSFRALHKISQLRRRHLVSAPTRLKWLKTAARKCRAYLWGRGSARESVPFCVCVCASEIY